MKKITLILLTIILAACTGASEYDQNLAKWQAVDVSHYRYDLFIGCFCPFAEDMPLTVEVLNGEIVSITSADGSPVEATDPSRGVYESYATIDRLFAELETDLSGEADEVVVTYDPTYGFPVNIAIDQIKEAIDDELSLQVSNFEILE